MKLNINVLKQIFFLFVLLSLLVLPYFVFAQDSNTNPVDRLKNVGSGDNGAYVEANELTLSTIIGQGVNILLSFLGIIFIILIILAGYHWMMAGGNEEQITKAKNSLKSSLIGLLIVVGAYAVWRLIASQLLS
ncbi:hypothetical protein K9M50_00615 [Patescibacteria group bacterium]|nr:hypothetical protein [Patescibacteria group bacterium]